MNPSTIGASRPRMESRVFIAGATIADTVEPNYQLTRTLKNQEKLWEATGFHSQILMRGLINKSYNLIRF